MNVGVIDYGAGNIKSVCNALKFIGCDFVLSDKKEKLDETSHLILPGVGSYKGTMDTLIKLELVEILDDLIIRDGRYFLGICVGMQILSERGDEFGETDGLGWIKGSASSLQVEDLSLPLPHVGWNEICGDLANSKLLFELNEDPVFYFVNSYALNLTEVIDCMGYSYYGVEFISMVEKENIFGVQFHPEKSQSPGLKLLNNFINL